MSSEFIERAAIVECEVLVKRNSEEVANKIWAGIRSQPVPVAVAVLKTLKTPQLRRLNIHNREGQSDVEN